MSLTEEVLAKAAREGHARDINMQLAAEGPGLPDMLANICAEEERDKCLALCGILNAFTLAKQKVAGSPFWTEIDLRAFSMAVRALNNTWENAATATARLDDRTRRAA